MSGAGKGPVDPQPPVAPPMGDPFADGSLDVPNCPDCLRQMEPADTPNGGVYWACADCGQVRLA